MTAPPPAEARPNTRLRAPATAARTSQQLYDVIVLGAQLAGTLAGALLAKRGYRVLHIDPEGLGSWYEDGGYQLPYAPGLLASPKLFPQGEAALGELGIAVELDRTMRAAPAELQLLLPQHRIELSASPERRDRELARELKEAGAPVAAALGSLAALAGETDPFFRNPLPLPPGGFFERRAVRKAAGQCPWIKRADERLAPLRASTLGDGVGALGRFLGYLDDEEGSAFARARPLSQLLQGLHRFPGGGHGLREAVRRRLGDLGADLVGGPRDPAVVDEFVFEGAHLTGLKLASSKHTFRAHFVIAATDVAALAPLVPPRSKKHSLSELFESVRVRRLLFTVNAVAKESGLPLGLRDLAVVVPGDPEIGPVLIEVQPARRGEKESAGERLVSMAAFIPAAERDAGEVRLREVGARIQATGLSIAPFMERHLVAISMPLLDAADARGRLAPHPLLEIAGDTTLGIGGLPHRTSCKNLFLASREVLPGLGLEGEFVTGVRAAALVQDALKKHDPLK